VNSAVDNPVNYFTSQSLNNRADQLNGLLDGMSNGIQTIQAASKGIDIIKLVSSMQSTIKQAQADAAQNRPTATGTALATAAEKIATSKSLKDIVLDKGLSGGVDTVNNTTGAATRIPSPTMPPRRRPARVTSASSPAVARPSRSPRSASRPAPIPTRPASTPRT
jgi:hypothetical protein